MPAAAPPTNYTDILQWDVDNWSRAIKYWDQHVPWHEVQTCLEIGANRGGLTQWLALKGKHVVCSDRSDISHIARGYHERVGVESLVRYEAIDATNIPYENEFDLIVFKSVLGGVGASGHKERQQQAVSQMHKALKPGGRLLFAENAVGSPLHRAARHLFVKWGDVWRYVSLAEMREFLAPFSSYELHTTGILGVFGRSESQRRALSMFDRAAQGVTPRGWKYIMYGIARK